MVDVYIFREREATGKAELEDFREGGKLARSYRVEPMGLVSEMEEAHILGQWPGMFHLRRGCTPSRYLEAVRKRKKASCKNRYSEIRGENELMMPNVLDSVVKEGNNHQTRCS